MIELRIKEISAYGEDSYFIAYGPNDDLLICRLYDKERDWDKLYNYLNKPMKVRGSIMVAGNFLVMEIIED